MKARRSSVLVVAVAFLFALGALAQPKGKGKKKEDPPPPPAETAAPAEPPPPPASATPPTADPELGERPPPAAATTGPRPSPLTPRPEELPDGGPQPAPKDYDALLGEIAALRGRVAALTSTLFASKVRVKVLVDDSDDARIDALRVTLDDGVVFAADKGFAPGAERTVYEHAVAPGHHVIGVEVERYDGRGRQWRTSQTTKVSVVVPEGKRVEAAVRIEEDSNMAVDFPEDQDGEYRLKVRVRARVVEK